MQIPGWILQPSNVEALRSIIHPWQSFMTNVEKHSRSISGTVKRVPFTEPRSVCTPNNNKTLETCEFENAWEPFHQNWWREGLGTAGHLYLWPRERTANFQIFNHFSNFYLLFPPSFEEMIPKFETRHCKGSLAFLHLGLPPHPKGLYTQVGRGYHCWSRAFPAYIHFRWELYPLRGLEDYGGRVLNPQQSDQRFNL